MTGKAIAWDGLEFREAVAYAASKGTFLNQKVRSMNDIYRIIAQQTNYSYLTVKGWGGEKSKGPSNPFTAERIKGLLDTAKEKP